MNIRYAVQVHTSEQPRSVFDGDVLVIVGIFQIAVDTEVKLVILAGKVVVAPELTVAIVESVELMKVLACGRCAGRGFGDYGNEIIAELKREGKTILIASHDPLVFEAAAVDCVITLRDGTIVQAKEVS